MRLYAYNFHLSWTSWISWTNNRKIKEILGQDNFFCLGSEELSWTEEALLGLGVAPPCGNWTRAIKRNVAVGVTDGFLSTTLS